MAARGAFRPARRAARATGTNSTSAHGSTTSWARKAPRTSSSRPPGISASSRSPSANASRALH
eukprot:11219014-Lingulodinium_polyedra.AAC.1